MRADRRRKSFVPLLRSRIGPGIEADFSVFRGHVEFDEALLRELVNPVAARLAPDLAMPRELAAGDLVLLDQNPALRERPGARDYWVVAGPTGLRVRYLRTSGGGSRSPAKPGGRFKEVAAAPLRDRNILDIVRARIVWLSRKMEKETAGPAEPPGESD